MKHMLLLFGIFTVSTPAHADSELEKGFNGALRGCEEWVLNPASWAQGVEPFISAVGLGDKMALVEQVEEATLPPPQLRRANHYWRINSTAGAGYILIVSDQLPMCHITGGGNDDLQPAIAMVIASTDFSTRWQRTADRSRGEMLSTEFRNRLDPALTMVISHARRPGERLDRVQVLATATYKLDK